MPKLGLKQLKGDILAKGIHPLGRIETALVPLSANKRENLMVTAFEGDFIECLSPLARPENGKGSSIYSPFSGRFISIKKLRIPGIGKLPCAEIQVKDIAEKTAAKSKRDLNDLAPKEILDACMYAGIVDELDGRRLWDKLEECNLRGDKVVAVDAVEDDPFCAAGMAVLKDHGEEVAKGLRFAGRAVGAQDLFIGIFDEDSIRGLFPNIYDDLPVKRFKGGYPLRHKLYANIEKRGGGIRIGAQAARALYRAVAFEEIQTDMVVTVAGDCILRCENYLVPIGTPVSELLYHAGAADDYELLLAGGSITGAEISAEIPVYAGLSSITAMLETGRKRRENCIGCGRCSAVCPKRLMPNYILEELERGLFTPVGEDAVRCIGCGCCTLVCPSRIEVTAGVLEAAERTKNPYHEGENGGQMDEQG